MKNTAISQNEFLQVISRTFNEPDQETRSQNEKQLTNLMLTSPEMFVALCTSCFNDDSLDVNLRKTISTVLKMAIKPTSENAHLSVWGKLSAGSQEQIQSCGLMNLISPTEQIKRSAADLVANAFALDCQGAKKWGNLLPTLKQNLENPDSNIRRSSIMTIGYICEILHTDKITSLSQEQIDSMISGICMSLKTYDENTQVALKSLEFSLNFISESMGSESLADFIMNLVIQALVEANKARHVEVAQQAVHCINEITKILFLGFGKYHSIVFEHLLNSYALRDFNLTMTLNEYFQLVVSLEKKYTQCDYTSKPVVKIIECVLENMLELLGGRLEASEDGKITELQKSSIFLISSLNTRHLGVTLGYLFKFIEHYIEAKRTDHKVAALSVLESIVYVSGQEKISEIIDQVFYGIVSYFQTPEIHIRMAAASVLKMVADKYPRKFGDSAKSKAVMPLIIASLASKDLESNFYMMVFNLIESMYEHIEMFTHSEKLVMRQDYRLLSMRLLELAEQTNVLYLINGAFCVTMQLMSKVAPADDYNEWFKLMWQMYCRFEKRVSSNEDFMRLDGVLINLNVIVQQMIMQDIRFKTGQFGEDFARACFNQIIDFFNNSQNVISEGILLLSSLIEMEPDNLRVEVTNFVENILGYTIAKENERDMFCASVHAIGSLTKIYRKNMDTFVMKVVPLFIGKLKQPETHRSTRVHLFMCLSDICTHSPDSITRHLGELLGLLELGFEATISLMKDESKENKLYGNKLKEALIEVVMCLAHGILNEDKYFAEKTMIEKFYPRILAFMKETSDPHYSPTVEHILQILMLLMDINTNCNLMKYWDEGFSNYLLGILAENRHDVNINEAMDGFKEFAKSKEFDHQKFISSGSFSSQNMKMNMNQYYQ